MEKIEFGDEKKGGILEIQHEKRDLTYFYRFQGDVNEQFSSELMPLPAEGCSKIVIDLEKVNNFNSVGIREWIYFNQKLKAIADLHYEKCSIAAVDQFNMVPDSVSGASIDSFYAPYYCTEDDCGRDAECLIMVKDHLKSLEANEAPGMTCKHDQGELEIDTIEEAYFSFLKLS